MTHIWKGPGALWGKGKPVLEGQPIPDGHVLPVRLKELSARIETKTDNPEPATKPPAAPEKETVPPASPPPNSGFDPQLDPTPPAGAGESTPEPETKPEEPEKTKRGPGRPPGSKNK